MLRYCVLRIHLYAIMLRVIPTWTCYYNNYIYITILIFILLLYIYKHIGNGNFL